MNQEEQEIEGLFFDAFLADLDEYPDHFEKLYNTPIDKIKADPEYYYGVEIDKNAYTEPEKEKESKHTGVKEKVAVRGSVSQKTGNKKHKITTLL